MILIFKNILDKFDPKHTALLVIDMQNDFCAEGGHIHNKDGKIEHLQEIVPILLATIDNARKVGAKIIFVRSDYSEDYLHAPLKEQFGDSRFALGGTWGAELYKVRPEKSDLIITKHTYDAFTGTELDSFLQTKKIQTLLMAGIISNVCVESSARTGFMLGYFIIMVKDCIGYRRKHLHEVALENISRYFGLVKTSQELLSLWENHLAKNRIESLE